ncbi:MAG TPA: hypothetical protein DDZ83_06400 [Nitrospinae bacterium]|nr:hypothetical protein [Nitrospinota bacterium]
MVEFGGTPVSRATSLLLALFLFFLPAAPQALGESAPSGSMSDTGKFAVSLISAPPWVRDNARAWMARRGKPDVAAALIMALRYVPGDRAKNTGVLKAITGANYGPDWNDWMLWQQAHPEVKSFEGFDRFQADLFARIDPNFRVFLRPGVKHEIRLEEIVWGGVKKDGIPALTNPELIPAAEADYLTKEELVFGVEINGDVHAYPLRFMDWHEMFNDVIGGVPVSLAY